MDRVRDSVTRCGRCERYVCCCKTGVDDVKLAARVPGNHLASYLARKNFRIEDFDLSGRVVGRGSFWEERLVRLRGARDRVFLLKSTRGAHAVRMLSQTNHVNAEREVLEKLCERNPRIINMFAYFRQPEVDAWHLVLEFVPGGTLESRIQAVGVLDIEDIKFYAAQTFLAVRFLRGENVAHRDLRPANLLITARGHLKLSGFTYAKTLRPGERTFTLIGTVNYMAPEILVGASMTAMQQDNGYEGYDGSVDWWSVGACVYEMAQGAAPLSNLGVPADQLRGLEGLAAGQPLKRIRRCVDGRVWDVICRFMCVDPAAREAFAGSNEVEEHNLFKFYMRERLQWSHFDSVETYPRAPYIPPPPGEGEPHSHYALLPDIRRSGFSRKK